MLYKENNVYDEALNRIRLIYDTHDDVIVSMSGGKDSTVLYNLALIIAKEKNRLPLKVLWLDQEAEWQHTVDYMDGIMRSEWVKPYWFQIPFDFTNSLSPQKNFLRVWDENEKDKWVHNKSDISIKENPSKYNRFHDLIAHLHEYCTDSDNCAVLVGMRSVESLNRRIAIQYSNAKFMGETWCQKKKGNIQVFWPIYDFTNDDVWTAIGRNKWEYNRIYDFMYNYGVPKQQMRVSALIHETSWHAIELLQEFEKETYNKFIRRVPGVSTYNHTFDSGEIIQKELPFAFKDWKEYRDYLLVHITKPEYWDLFRNRWKNQDGDEWYKVHVKEIILNDIDGTNNKNAKVTLVHKQRVGKDGLYNKKYKDDFEKWRQESDD